ncbi:MAG: hypothetical protein MJ188_09635 [Treponema sp.]|nr:hypothetical protein [Treponema sp.]
MQNSKLNKMRTVLAVLLLIFTIFSVTFTAAETGHTNRCREDNCPICFVIHVTKANLGGLILIFATSQIFHHFAESKNIAFSSINKSYISNTLFSQKIRLND